MRKAAVLRALPVEGAFFVRVEHQLVAAPWDRARLSPERQISYDAFLQGRGFVTPDDVKALAYATLAHRLTLRPEAELEGVSVASVLSTSIASVPVPR